MKFEVGDRVKVARRGPDRWDGGNCEWIPEMNSAVGQTYTIKKVCRNGVNFEERNCKWPFECLELVNPKVREGDLVVITDYGGIYSSTYQEMADLMGLTNRREMSYPTQLKDRLFKVLQVRPHLKRPEEIVAGIEDPQTGEQFLFDSKSLRVIAVQPTPNKETQIMAEKVFETKSYIRGTEISKLTTDDLIEVIRRTEEEIASLEQIKTKSKAITARIAGLKEELAKVVEVLDGRA